MPMVEGEGAYTEDLLEPTVIYILLDGITTLRVTHSPLKMGKASLAEEDRVGNRLQVLPADLLIRSQFRRSASAGARFALATRAFSPPKQPRCAPRRWPGRTKLNGSDVNQHFVTDAVAPHGSVRSTASTSTGRPPAPWSRELEYHTGKTRAKATRLAYGVTPPLRRRSAHGVGRRVGRHGPGVRQPHRRLDVTGLHAAVIARGITGRSVVDDSRTRCVGRWPLGRDARGPAQAQQQLSRESPATTEAHYLQRQTRGPDVRAVPDKYADGDSGD